jgi:hypothetical protein
MLSAWQVSQASERASVKDAVFQMWVRFYLAELERYYESHAGELAIEHSLAIHRSGNYLDAIVTAVLAFWHIGRLGILAFSCSELLVTKTQQERQAKDQSLQKIANWLVSLLNANPAASRPLLDLNHIELFLIWRTLVQLGRYDDVYRWLVHLRSSLLVRRAGTVPLPFIEGRNSLELVFEHVATGEKPPEFCDQSSLLLLCILEFCFSLDTLKRNELITLFYTELVLGQDSDGEQMKDTKPIDLMGWVPPEDWGVKVLKKSLADEGESQTLGLFAAPPGTDGSAVAAGIEEFVSQNLTARKTTFPIGLPASVIVLACLKHRSPLPADMWRLSVFKAQTMK